MQHKFGDWRSDTLRFPLTPLASPQAWPNHFPLVFRKSYDSLLITGNYPRGGKIVLCDGQGFPKIPPRHIPKTPDPGYFA
jgi:hypothetical protein